MKLEDALQTKGFSSEEQKAALNIMYTSYVLRTQTSLQLKEFDLTPEQFNVLRILKGKHPEKMCVRDIAGRMIERSSNVPRILDRLVAKKFVNRITSSEDKRETVMNLTQAGLDILSTVNPVMEQLNKNLSGLKKSELVTLNELLERYRDNIEK